MTAHDPFPEFFHGCIVILGVILITNLVWGILNRTSQTIDDDESESEEMDERSQIVARKFSFRMARNLKKKELKEVIRSFKEELEGVAIGAVQHEYHTGYIQFHLLYEKGTSDLDDLRIIIDSWRRRFNRREQTQQDHIQQNVEQEIQPNIDEDDQPDDTRKLLLDLQSKYEQLAGKYEQLAGEHEQLADQHKQLADQHQDLQDDLKSEKATTRTLTKRMEQLDVEMKVREESVNVRFEELCHEVFIYRTQRLCTVWRKRFITRETKRLSTASSSRSSGQDRGTAKGYWGNNSCVVSGANKLNRPSDWPEGSNKFPFTKLGHLFPRADEAEARKRYPPQKYSSPFRIGSPRNMLYMRYDVEFAFDRQILSFVEKFGQYHCVVILKDANEKVRNALAEYLQDEDQSRSYVHTDEEIQMILDLVDVESLNNQPLRLLKCRPYGRVLFDHLSSAVMLRDEDELVDPNIFQTMHVVMDMSSSSTISDSTAKSLSSYSETGIIG